MHLRCDEKEITTISDPPRYTLRRGSRGWSRLWTPNYCSKDPWRTSSIARQAVLGIVDGVLRWNGSCGSLIESAVDGTDRRWEHSRNEARVPHLRPRDCSSQCSDTALLHSGKLFGDHSSCSLAICPPRDGLRWVPKSLRKTRTQCIFVIRHQNDQAISNTFLAKYKT